MEKIQQSSLLVERVHESSKDWDRFDGQLLSSFVVGCFCVDFSVALFLRCIFFHLIFKPRFSNSSTTQPMFVCLPVDSYPCAYGVDFVLQNPRYLNTWSFFFMFRVCR